MDSYKIMASVVSLEKNGDIKSQEFMLSEATLKCLKNYII